MADTPPTYDPNAGGHRGARPLANPAKSYGAEPLGQAVSVGGFKYDEATLHDLAKQWQNMSEEFLIDLGHAEVLARTKGPGREYASGGNAELIRGSGEALSRTILERIRYCDAMAAKYIDALGKYATAEELHSTEIAEKSGGIL